MKIGLIDVDGHNFPNLALMKISAWHKAQGDEIEMLFPMNHYEKAYMSKVFDFTPDFKTIINADEIIRGGTAYGLDNELPIEIESMYPDYSLYGITDTAYGYLTRGCPRGCEFCIVGEKEGLKSYKVADLKQFWNGQKEIKLLDPNLLACENHMELLQQLIDSKAWVDFTQGIDARLLTSDNVQLLKQIKIKIIHFAWDNPADETVPYMLWHFKRATNIDRRKASVYVLTNFNSTFEQDLHRVYKLRELGYYPYVMIYDKQNAHDNVRYLQRWVNNKRIFLKIKKFEDYDHRVG